MKIVKRVAAAVAAILIALGFLPGCAATNKQWHTDCLLIAKELIYSYDQTAHATRHDRRLATSCGQFRVEDAWAAGVFESYDLWSRLQEGRVYDIRTGGFRIGILSNFPIVLDVKEK